MRKMPQKVARNIAKSLEQIAKGDETGQRIERLHGKLKNQYRLVKGGWRVIFEWRDGRQVLMVLRIRPRGDVYKK